MFTKAKKKLVVQNLSSPKRLKGQRNFLPRWRKADDRGKTRELFVKLSKLLTDHATAAR